jgi:hypothetical protein
MWHVLSHTYTHQPGGPHVQNSISGHLFARNITGPWHVSPIEPYDSVVAYAATNTTETFSTMVRKRLLRHIMLPLSSKQPNICQDRLGANAEIRGAVRRRDRS